MSECTSYMSTEKDYGHGNRKRLYVKQLFTTAQAKVELTWDYYASFEFINFLSSFLFYRSFDNFKGNP